MRSTSVCVTWIVADRDGKSSPSPGLGSGLDVEGSAFVSGAGVFVFVTCAAKDVKVDPFASALFLAGTLRTFETYCKPVNPLKLESESDVTFVRNKACADLVFRSRLEQEEGDSRAEVGKKSTPVVLGLMVGAYLPSSSDPEEGECRANVGDDVPVAFGLEVDRTFSDGS